MSNMNSCIRHIMPPFLLLVCMIFTLPGCSSKEAKISSEKHSAQEYASLRSSEPLVINPEASGEIVYGTEVVSMDISNTSNGYMILTYSGTNEKVKFQIAAPNEITYTYLISDYNVPIIYPLSGGNGSYTFSLLESVDAEKDLYAIAYTETANVTISDEFLPFLTPNVYIHFEKSSASVAKGEELAEECYCDLDVINNIYHYVTSNITYDEEKAKSVPYGYTPDPDETLSSGKGICFDYASLMSAMLRSQQIPTKLEVGYAGEVYHAWISCYVDEIGWVDNIIEFNGESWSLMDPTLAANNSSSAVQEYIGDGSKYIVKYTY